MLNQVTFLRHSIPFVLWERDIAYSLTLQPFVNPVGSSQLGLLCHQGKFLGLIYFHSILARIVVEYNVFSHGTMSINFMP